MIPVCSGAICAEPEDDGLFCIHDVARITINHFWPKCVVDCNVSNIGTVTPLLKEDIYFDSALCVEAF
jgi:hypothetical protein